MRKTIYVTKSSIVTVLLFVIFLGIYSFGTADVNGIANVQGVSILGLFILAFIIVSWKRNYYRFLSPYIIFELTLYLTLCGQTIPWAFGARAGYRDLTIAIYNRLQFSDSSICRALLFSYLCLLCTHVIALNSIRAKKMGRCSIEDLDENEAYFGMINDCSMYKVVVMVGLIFTVVAAIPYFASGFSSYVNIRLGGYGSQYENVSYGLSSVMAKIGEFYPVGALTLIYAWGRRNEYNVKNFTLKFIFAYSIMASYLVMELLLSQRTCVLLFSIALLFIYFPRKRIPKLLLLFAFGGALVMMAGMRMVDMLRSGSIEGLADFIDYSGGDSNPIVDFLGDLGWNLMTTIEFQQIIPNKKPLGWGFSYLISLTSAIPNLNFWDVHPATLYGNISAWLQKYLNFSFGIGCTPVAEAYYNFGDFGWIVFIFWGKFMVYLTKKFEETSSILNNYLVVLFMGILLKSAVRSSFYAVFRPYLFYIVVPIMLIRLLYRVLHR